MRLRPQIFLANRRLLAEKIYISFLIYIKAIYVQKMNEIDFSTLATQCSIFPDRRSKEQAIRSHAAIKAMWTKKKTTTTTTTDTSQNTGLNTSTDSGALSCASTAEHHG